ncbi:MAG: hypothetical protein V4507_00335 [Verrucomicrobiota bacterium]
MATQMEYIATIRVNDFRIPRGALVAFAEEFFGKELVIPYSDVEDHAGEGWKSSFELPILEIEFRDEKMMLEFFLALAANFRKQQQ